MCMRRQYLYNTNGMRETEIVVAGVIVCYVDLFGVCLCCHLSDMLHFPNKTTKPLFGMLSHNKLDFQSAKAVTISIMMCTQNLDNICCSSRWLSFCGSWVYITCKNANSSQRLRHALLL